MSIPRSAPILSPLRERTIPYNELPTLTPEEFDIRSNVIYRLLPTKPLPQIQTIIQAKFSSTQRHQLYEEQKKITLRLPPKGNFELEVELELEGLPEHFEEYTDRDWGIHFHTRLSFSQLVWLDERIDLAYKDILPFRILPSDPTVDDLNAYLVTITQRYQRAFTDKRKKAIIMEHLQVLAPYDIFRNPKYRNSFGEKQKSEIRNSLALLVQNGESDFVYTIREQLLPEDIPRLMNLSWCANGFNLEIDPLRKSDEIVSFIFEDEMKPGVGKLNSGDCVLVEELKKILQKFTGTDTVTLWRRPSNYTVYKLPYSGVWVQTSRNLLETFNTFLLRKVGSVPIGSQMGISALHGSSELVYKPVPIHRANLLQEVPGALLVQPFVPQPEDFQPDHRWMYRPGGIVTIKDDGSFTYMVPLGPRGNSNPIKR